MVCMHPHDSGYRIISYNSLILGNIYGNPLSSEKVFINKHVPTLHYTLPNGVCSKSCTINCLYTCSPYNSSPFNPRRCMVLHFLFGCINLINPGFFDTALWRLGSTHKLHGHCSWKRTKTSEPSERNATRRVSKPTRSICRHRRVENNSRRGFVVHYFLLFFQLRDIPAAPRQR